MQNVKGLQSVDQMNDCLMQIIPKPAFSRCCDCLANASLRLWVSLPGARRLRLIGCMVLTRATVGINGYTASSRAVV